MNSICPISVIIPTFNRHQSLKNTIETLYSGSYIPKEIIVIDQSEIVFSKEEIVIPSGCELIVVHQRKPSATTARNKGIEIATNEYLLFSDDDILLNEESIEIVFKYISQEQVGLIAGMHYELSGVFSNTTRSLLRDIGGTLLGMKKAWRKDAYVIKSNLRGRYTQSCKDVMNTEWAQGYFFCVKRHILDEMTEFFDERLIRYSYAEDLDFTYRYCMLCKQKGLLAFVDPHIYVNHLATKEWRVKKQEEVLYLFANRRYLSYKLFPKKWYYRIGMTYFDYMYVLSESRKSDYQKQLLKGLKICREYKKQIKTGDLEVLQEALHE